jgi:hypothetical protein
MTSQEIGDKALDLIAPITDRERAKIGRRGRALDKLPSVRELRALLQA